MSRTLRLSPSFFDANAPAPSASRYAEPALSYAPPYERTVDDQLAWLMVRYLHPASELQYRARVETTVGSFLLDFVVARGRTRVGFLVSDGEDEGVSARPVDSYWQSLVLASGAIDAVYSIVGEDVAGRMVDALSVVAGWQPELFSPDGLAELSSRASRVGRTCALNGTASEVSLHYSTRLEDQYAGEQFEWPGAEPERVLVRRQMAAARSPRVVSPQRAARVA